MNNNTRPKLNSIDLNLALENMTKVVGFTVTMSEDQWDIFLEEGYYRQNATLIELDQKGQPIAAYKKC